MHGRVTRKPRIELPSKREDELPLRSLIATSLACALAGLSVAYALTDRSATDTPAAAAPDMAPELEPIAEPAVEPPTTEPAPEPAAAPIAEARGEPSSVSLSDATIAALEEALGPADAAVAAPAAAALADTPVGPPMASEPAPAATVVAQPDVPHDPPARALRVDPGFFAYLRCEGVRQRKGRYPCPRDRALEERMREIVEALPSCREAHAVSRGMFDVRLELGQGGAVTDLHVKAPNEGAERAVRACAAAAFRKAQTTLRPKRMIVSMRFRAR